jgi:hypothetical protein
MAATRIQNDFVCVECGLKSDEVYKEFKGGSFKLCICVSATISLRYSLLSDDNIFENTVIHQPVSKEGPLPIQRCSC